VLFDRRAIYAKLEGVGVPVPKHVVLEPGSAVVDEQEDYIEVDGARLQKPIVEKPISGEDHDIRIYYPRSAGGGSKRLFRKVGDKASQFYPDEHESRATSGEAYIYEELLQTEGTDVKVYAVGPEYAHAEARKSPVVDGKVIRNARGKELRYPLILNNDEKEIARKVVLAFGQTLCGFDLLRSEGRSYVCDVNGWSFVKDSHKFWADSANLLRQYCLHAICPHHVERHPQGAPQVPPPNRTIRDSVLQDVVPPRASLQAPTGAEESELLCVIGLTRHGDRTPKQKLKMKTTEPRLLALLGKNKDARAELKIKKIRAMEELTQIVSRLVEEKLRAADPSSERYEEDLDKLLTVQQVLQSHPFSGINRKVQIKPSKWAAVPEAGSADGGAAPPASREVAVEALFILKWGGELTALGEAQAEYLGAKFRNSLYPGDEVGGGVLRLHSTYRHDLKIYSSDEGRVQTTAAAFTKGFLDLEGALPPILASLVSKDKSATAMLDDTNEQGRLGMDRSKAVISRLLNCPQTTAGAIAAQESSRPPSPSSKQPRGLERGLEHGQIVAQAPSTAAEGGLASDSLLSAWLSENAKAPRQALERLHQLVEELVRELRARSSAGGGASSIGIPRVPSRDVAVSSGKLSSKVAAPARHSAANGETPHLQLGRWAQLHKDLYSSRKDVFDTSKVPDIYDNALYDMVHNEHLGLQALPRLFRASRTLASYVVPQEYGIEPEDKVTVGLQIAWQMLAKLLQDMLAGMDAERHMEERVHELDPSAFTDVKSSSRHVRTRLYFTSESHILSLFNVLRYGHEVLAATQGERASRGVQCIFSDEARVKFEKLDVGYLSHIVFRVLHKKNADPQVPSSYAVQVLVSQGVNQNMSAPSRGGPCQAEWHERPELLPSDMFISSRDDLTLEDVDCFFSYFLRSTPLGQTKAAPQRQSSTPSASSTTLSSTLASESSMQARASRARRASGPLVPEGEATPCVVSRRCAGSES